MGKAEYHQGSNTRVIVIGKLHRWTLKVVCRSLERSKVFATLDVSVPQIFVNYKRTNSNCVWPTTFIKWSNDQLTSPPYNSLRMACHFCGLIVKKMHNLNHRTIYRKKNRGILYRTLNQWTQKMPDHERWEKTVTDQRDTKNCHRLKKDEGRTATQCRQNGC